MVEFSPTTVILSALPTRLPGAMDARSLRMVRSTMAPVITVLRLNGQMDVSRMLEKRVLSDPEIQALNDLVDWTRFRQTDTPYKRDVSLLLVFCFACSMRAVLDEGTDYGEERKKLRVRLDIVRHGSMKEDIRYE